MNVRWNTLWKVPIYCLVSSWVSFYLTVYLGGFFFAVQEVDADGIIHISADPLRSAIFNAIVFLLVLFAGGLWAFRSMTKTEIAVSAAVTSAVYLMIVIVQLVVPNPPLSVGIALTYFQNWTGMLSSFLFRLTGHLPLSAVVSSFAPLLFIPFGRKAGT